MSGKLKTEPNNNFASINGTKKDTISFSNYFNICVRSLVDPWDKCGVYMWYYKEQVKVPFHHGSREEFHWQKINVRSYFRCHSRLIWTDVIYDASNDAGSEFETRMFEILHLFNQVSLDNLKQGRFSKLQSIVVSYIWSKLSWDGVR